MRLRAVYDLSKKLLAGLGESGRPGPRVSYQRLHVPINVDVIPVACQCSLSSHILSSRCLQERFAITPRFPIMFGFLSSQPKAPQRVPTDHVVPVGFFDDTIIFRTFVLYTLFVFDDVLDVQKLHSSLERVVSRPGWNKMGARLRRNVIKYLNAISQNRLIVG